MFNLFQNILDKTKSTFANQNPTQNLQYKAINKLAGGVSAVTGQGMEDKTQSLVFKGIQGSANLYTGVTNGLQQTAQADIADKQKKIDDNARKYASHLASQGYSQEKIFKTLDLLKKEGKLTAKPNVAESIVGGFGNRMEKIAQTTDRLSNIQNPLERTVKGVLPYMGQTVATPLQPIASGIEPFVSPVVQKVIEKTGQTENVQALSEGWSQFEKTNPILAENIAGLLNTAQVLPVPFAKPVAGAIKQGVNQTGKAIVRGADMVSPSIVQGAKQLAKTPQALGKLATTGTEYSTSLATGLSREAQKTIKQSPELYKQARLGGITAQGELGNFIKATEARLTDLSELGKGYDAIKKGNKVANIDDITNAYVKATEGVRDRTLTKADKLVLKDANDYMSQMKGQLDETDILGLRRQLDSIMYDPNTSMKRKLSPTGERIVNSMRSEIDKIAKDRIVGLKELDAQYAPEVGLLKDIKKQIYDANGNIKPTALSTISNIVGKNKDFKLEQFQKIYPELGARIKALKAFEEVSAIGEMKTGSIARQLGGAALGSTVAPVIGTIAGWVATNPYVVARLLETYGLAKAKISEILKKGAKITPEDAKIVQKAVVAIPKAKVEDIINNLSFDPKKEVLTSGNIGPKRFNTMGKQEKVTTPQSVTAYEQGMRRPYTLQANKPIVKRASDSPKPIGVDKPKSTPVKNQLVEEARKYKSAEEFVNKQRKSKSILHHGTSIKFDKFDKEKLGSGGGSIYGEGIFLSDNVEVAKSFAKGVSGGKEGFILDIPNIKKLKLKEYNGPVENLQNIQEQAIKEGYDGIKYPTREDYAHFNKINTLGSNNYLIFPESIEKLNIIDLKQIYEQANKPKSIVKNPESSQTQANGPRVIGKMGKVETKTSPQSATSYEAGMRRPFTMQSNNPIVKRVQEKPSNPLVEEARIKEKKAYEIADRTLSKYGIKTKDIKIVGSRAKGTEKPTSDIDIIITPDENIKKLIPDFPVKWNESEIQLNRKLRLEIEKNLEELFGKDISLDVNLGFAKKMPGEDKVYAISLSEFLKKKLK